MMMKKSPNCTTIGEKTWGSSGNPKPHDLGNGVTIMLPSWRDLDPDSNSIESIRLAPDLPVKFNWEMKMPCPIARWNCFG
jgi:C-terminal processing protease CtpA/Prc